MIDHPLNKQNDFNFNFISSKFAGMACFKGKITAIHCDGRLTGLKHLIAEIDHDIIHAITRVKNNFVGVYSIKKN